MKQMKSKYFLFYSASLSLCNIMLLPLLQSSSVTNIATLAAGGKSRLDFILVSQLTD
jgi:hypothetical protein